MELDLKERNRKSHLFIYGIYSFLLVNKILVRKKRNVQQKKSTIRVYLKKRKGHTPIQSNLDHQNFIYIFFMRWKKSFALNDGSYCTCFSSI